ncbi:Mitochondrial intermembrane space cysteine motif-containing protein MIX23 [Candida viswanathii]|uniref:Mitochondrial intermembrane space cysteine motif-containing protein MIX23 n=1 Tax=Candida viswanathii TaxID=5486 RepID=A0A367XXP7_9ASCO|nr:Mitochondrial intermembrane space cysteine motif-containing protein MIX23 [Candida viswanathii]
MAPTSQLLNLPLEVPSNLLTPEGCVSSSRIRAFLKRSRQFTDDTIRPHLNEIAKSDCSRYFQEEIAPQWKLRGEIIDYCSKYSQELRQKTSQGKTVENATTLSYNLDNADEVTKKFDLRTDPYAYKTYQKNLEEQYRNCDALDNWTHNEATVEKIIREHTIEVLNDRCFYQDWMQAFRKAAFPDKS